MRVMNKISHWVTQILGMPLLVVILSWQVSFLAGTLQGGLISVAGSTDHRDYHREGRVLCCLWRTVAIITRCPSFSMKGGKAGFFSFFLLA